MTFDRQITYHSRDQADKNTIKATATIKVATREERSALSIAQAQAKPKDEMRLLRSLEDADGDSRTIASVRDAMVTKYELPLVFRDFVVSVEHDGVTVSGEQFAKNPESSDELVLEIYNVAIALMGMTKDQQKKFLSAFTSSSPATEADGNTTADTVSNAG